MTIGSFVSLWMRRAMQAAYRPPVRRAVDWLGVRSLLRRVYDSADLEKVQVHQLDISGEQAQFQVRSIAESQSLKENQTAEIPVIEDLLSRLSPGDVFYDVGAWFGVYSVFAGKKGAEVHSFDPVPFRAQRCHTNIELNDLQAEVHEFALSGERGQFQISKTGTPHEEGSDTLTADTYAADELISEGDLPTPDVVKIDVEGAELEVLEGLANTLSGGGCRAVYCEAHRKKLPGGDVDAVEAVLEQAGYSVDAIHSRGGEVFYRALRD